MSVVLFNLLMAGFYGSLFVLALCGAYRRWPNYFDEGDDWGGDGWGPDAPSPRRPPGRARTRQGPNRRYQRAYRGRLLPARQAGRRRRTPVG